MRNDEINCPKIVASGFDAAAGDELGGCFVTPACYAHMTHMLMTLANGKVAVCLEVGSLICCDCPGANSDACRTGWIQLPIYLQICFGSCKDSDGRASRQTDFDNSFRSGRSNRSKSHDCAIKVLEVHVPQGTTAGGAFYGSGPW